jgi:transcriptional regulator with XRE-family HTH domain
MVAVSKAAKQAFAKRVASLREERELTQVELGKMVGVTGTCVWNWEGGNTFPRQGAMTKLAHALGTSADYLSSGKGPSSTAKPDGSASTRLLADIIMEARQSVATAAGVPVNKVRVVLDCGD